MPKRNRAQIQSDAMKILEDAVGGIRWAELLRETYGNDPETPYNSVHGAIHALLRDDPRVLKVARGTYQLREYANDPDDAGVTTNNSANEIVEIQLPTHRSVQVREIDFYESFASWLIDDAEEVNEAAVIGGSLLRGKWGTPDVIGVLKPRTQDLFKFEPQIVSAEIKIDPSQPVTAFGQAVAYRLFSHKSYIVVPNTTSDEDLARLKALCTINGVGLVTFTPDIGNPDYKTLVLPALASPDMFYTNQMLRRMLEADPRAFDRLF
jgi:hypothetical protein